MKKSVFLLCFFVLGFNLNAEPVLTPDQTEPEFPTDPLDLPKSVFALDLKKDIILSALSLGTRFGSRLISDSTIYQKNLDVNDINFIDRGLVFHRSQLRHVASVTMASWIGGLPVIVPLGLVGWSDLRSDFNIWLTYGVMYAQAMGFTLGTRGAIGRIVGRPRPYNYLAGFIEGPLIVNSFPSGTTAMAFMPATFLSVTFSAEFPDSRWKIPIIVGSHTLAAAVGAGRIVAGTHFLTDVLAGAAIGSFFGWLIPTLHRRPNDENNLSFRFTESGAIMSVRL